MRDRKTWALAFAGGALLMLALLWHVGLRGRWTQRIPPGWSVEYDYAGTQTFAVPGATELPVEDQLARYRRRRYLKDERGRPDQVVIEDSYVVREIDSDTILFEYVTQHAADPATGGHVTPGWRGDILLFPREVQKRTYTLRSNYLKGIPLAFERTDTIEGLETYVFSYAGPAEYTESYGGTEAMPGIPVEPGQEIRCADDGFRYRTWIEPATGSVVKVEEGCPAGDYVFDVATGKRGRPVDRWGGVTAGRSLFAQEERVRALRARYLLVTRYIPGGLIGGGLLLLGAAASRRLRSAAQ